MKKIGTIILIAVLLVAGVMAAIFLPKRIKLYNAIKDNIETLGPEGEMFAHYDATDDTLIRVGNEYITLCVPGGTIYEDRDLIEVYQTLDGSQSVSLGKSTNDVEVSFFDPDLQGESEIFGIEYNWEDLKKGLEKFGYGIPDSTYDTYKCLYLLKESDYSFWDYEKGLAYANAAYVKNQMPWMDAHYLYEREDLYATIMERELQDEGIFYYCVDLYKPENLNESYTVIIRAKDENQAYAIINSIEFIK